MKSFRFICLLVALLTFFGRPSGLYCQTANPSQAQAEALQKQLDDLRAQVATLQEQIKTLSGTPAQTAVQPAEKPKEADAETELKSKSAAQVSKAAGQYETFSQDPLAAPRIDNAPLDPRYPGYFRLPGTRTFLRIGGYFKSDFVYDLKPAGESEKFLPSTIPIPAPPGVNNSTVSVRPTRLSLDFLIPTESVDTVRFYLEGDLFGSNATTPRMRHAYAQVKNLLIGQSFSNFMDPDSGPDQLDFQGPNGQVSIRNPQIRYSFKVGKKTSVSLAVEKPSSDVSFKTTDSVSAIPNTPSPDGTIKLRHDSDGGHVQLSALFRSVGAYLPDGRNESVFGWGLNFTGSQRVFRKDTVVYQGAYGYGIERYINDTSGLGIDASVEGVANPHLEALPVVGTYGAYQHFWTSRLRSSAIYGFAQVQNSDRQPGSSFHNSHYSAANLIWNAVGSLNLGAEFLYGWQVRKDGSSGNAPRFMLSAKYNFIQMKAPERGKK